jgi:hypothetical protein
MFLIMNRSQCYANRLGGRFLLVLEDQDGTLHATVRAVKMKADCEGKMQGTIKIAEIEIPVSQDSKVQSMPQGFTPAIIAQYLVPVPEAISAQCHADGGRITTQIFRPWVETVYYRLAFAGHHKPIRIGDNFHAAGPID